MSLWAWPRGRRDEDDASFPPSAVGCAWDPWAQDEPEDEETLSADRRAAYLLDRYPGEDVVHSDHFVEALLLAYSEGNRTRRREILNAVDEYDEHEAWPKESPGSRVERLIGEVLRQQRMETRPFRLGLNDAGGSRGEA